MHLPLGQVDEWKVELTIQQRRNDSFVPERSEVEWFNSSSQRNNNTPTMPTLGPSLLFAAGLALGLGTGVLIPRTTKRNEVVLPPAPPSAPHESDRAAGGVVLPSGPLAVQTGFPGESCRPWVFLGAALTHSGPTSDVIKRTAYTAAYDRQRRHPAWTAEHLTAASLARTPPASSSSQSIPLADARAADTSPTPGARGDRTKSTFMEDEEVPEPFRAKLQDCVSRLWGPAETQISRAVMIEGIWSLQQMPRYRSKRWTRLSTLRISLLKLGTASIGIVSFGVVRT